jgi:uncharacterized protein (DUF1800 family)
MLLMDRRDFLRMSAAATAASTAAGALVGCAPLTGRLSGVPVAPGAGPWPGMEERPADLAGLRRLSTGPTIQERRRVAEIGLAGWIEEQLAADPTEDGDLGWRLRRMDTPWRAPDELDGRRPELVRQELAAATLLRRIYGDHPLTEQVVEQWLDHFNISVDKGEVWRLAPTWDREVPRAHALGRFDELLGASVRAPAMLTYLDNRNSLPEAPNENHARELLELHSLGVEGGYGQADVRALARALTGWTVREHLRPDRFHFAAERHDSGAKRLPGLDMDLEAEAALGVTGRDTSMGQAEVEAVIARLATHPSTARRVALRLARRFLADDPMTEAPEVVARTEAAFLASGGDLRATLRSLLLDGLWPLLAEGGTLPPKLKRPADFVVSALRVTAAETDAGRPVQNALAAMGHAPYRWPTPDGPPDTAAPWLGGLQARWAFAVGLVSAQWRGTRIDTTALATASGATSPPELVDRLAGLVLGESLAADQRDAIVAALPAEADEDETAAITLAALLASPAFQWR